MQTVSVRNLSYSYPDGTKALSTLSFDISAYESVGIIGSNGAGKTTLINHLCGYTLPQSGEVVIEGIVLAKKQLSEIRKKVGVIFQSADDQLFMPSVIEDVSFGLRSQGCSFEEANSRAKSILSSMELSDLANKPPFHLSQGQKRFVAFAGILVMQPAIILMDEPTSDLDSRHRRILIRLTEKLSTTTRIIVSHDLDFLWETCSRILVLNQGALIADGSVREILTSKELLEQNGLELPLRLQG